MEKRKYALLLLFSLFFSLALSQGEYVVEINKSNGTFIKTGPAIAGITYIYPDDRTYDENTATFIFPSALINHSLYSIDVSNGAIVNNPVIGTILAFQFDNSSNILYALEQDNANNVKNLISINPANGSYIQIGNSIPGSSAYSGNFSTFDKSNHTFIFLHPGNFLYSIDATNGTVISNPALSLAPNESIVNFAFDNSTGTLYGLLQDNILQKYFLIIIDQAAGTHFKIGSGTIFGAAGSSAIDEINQQYIYMYYNPTTVEYAVTTLDLATGNVVYNAPIQGYVAPDNFFSLKYDNIQGKLYAIHWETNAPLTPVINLACSDTAFCEKQCIDFYDLSTNNPTSWQWFFPGADSTTSTLQNPTNICYNTYGSFDVTLIACNAVGCDTLVLQGFISEYPAPVPVITQSNDTLYSSPGNAYQWWSVSGGMITGATNNYFVPTQAGDYYVMVTDSIGCEGASNTIIITSVNEWSIVSGQLSVIPNPNDGNFTVILNQPVKDFTLRIIDPLGRIIHTEDGWPSHQPVTKINIAIKDASNGLYEVELIANEKFYRQKFLKK